MGESRRSPATSLARRLAISVVLLVAGCAAPIGSEAACPTPPSSVETVDGWVGYLRTHPDDVALVLDDGRGTRVEHRANAVQPMASASKALNLVAYARAVAAGTVSPAQPVRIGDWERWAVTGGGEQAHAQALDHLGIPRNGMRARDPDRTVTLDQIVNQMIIYSDNAAPDFLRNKLGDQSLIDAARAVGWHDPELPSTTGFTVSFFTPELTPPPHDRAARRAAEWKIAHRYAYNPAFRADVDSRPVPAAADEPAFTDGGPGGTTNQLAALWSAIGHGTFPGARIARRIAEQKPDPQPGILGIGAKGGRTPGILARGTELRRQDGTVAVAVLLIRRINPADWHRINQSSQAFNQFLTSTLRDPTTLNAVACRFPSA